MQNSKIILEILLDENKIPEKIFWTAAESDDASKQPSKALMLSLFHEQTKETMRIDLWTKEMQVMEMDRFYYHSLKSMADNYLKATGNEKMASAMRQLAQYFGEETQIIPKPEH